MPKYSCERCCKEFLQKSHYDSHKRRKKPCEKYENKVEKIIERIVDEKINDLKSLAGEKINDLKSLAGEKIIDLKSLVDEKTDSKLYESKIDTFKTLYEFLQNYENSNITTWLQDPWVGKDKQESLLRLFAPLGLIDKLNNYTVCKGNFNLKTISKINRLKDVFYDEKNVEIKLKDKGDSSDLTCISKDNDKHLLLTTSKNLNKSQVGKLEIDKILTNFRQYEGYSMSLCICIRDINDFKVMKSNIEDTNKELKSLLEQKDTIIIDWNDLNQAYNQFKLNFANRPLDHIINSNKPTLCLKMHQHFSVSKTIKMKNESKLLDGKSDCKFDGKTGNNTNKVLWGHIQRSGKSYIIAGCIIEDSKDVNSIKRCHVNEHNYLIITTAPNETIEQQRKVFDCLQLENFNVIVLNGKTKKPKLTNKNIIICSKQYLQSKIDTEQSKIDTEQSVIDNERDKKQNTPLTEKTKSIPWLKAMKFNMRFIDESHNGGTTELAQKTLSYYGKDSFTVQITATYSKPVNDYNIPKDNWILWDLEDVKLCKFINSEANITRLVKKHGEEIHNIIKKYSYDNIIAEYSKYPDLWLLTDEIKPDVASEIIQHTKDNEYGWSSEACFLLKQCFADSKANDIKQIIIQEEFQNEAENLKLWYKIFGKEVKYGIPDKKYPDNLVFMKRIQNICAKTGSRFMREGDYHNEPMIIMAFLPQVNIDKVSKATITLLEKHKVIPDYEIISINSKTTNDPKQSIEDARIKARNSNKKGVLVLSGRQCSLGVSIDNCDIVLLLNNNMGFDMIYQMMFRCMTEGKNKRCGFVVDLNIHRVIETSIINYASIIKPDLHPKDSVKYILQERLINLNGDHWLPAFGNDLKRVDTLCDNVYEIYSSNTEAALNHLLTRLSFKEILLSKEEQKIFNTVFSIGKIKKKSKVNEAKDGIEIKDGIEVKNGKDCKDCKDTIKDCKNDTDEKQIKYTYILKHIIPLVCLLTIHNKETSFIEMFNLIKDNECTYKILIDQIKSWWGKSIDSDIIKQLIDVYTKYMKNDKETNQIIRSAKELFIKNINNSKQLSQLIDKYLIPQELEKKTNAEVSTPYALRQEMLDKIPADFWTKKKRVFEPCSGKGGFIIDIIDRFMIGLKDEYKDEKIRYKTIVEECLYFSDINPTNIFICKLLINPINEYKINYNEGNTLELDIKEKWCSVNESNRFDAVIGNPPYNAAGNTGTGNTIWQEFTKIALQKWILPNGYLLYVHPPGWRKPNTERGKYYRLYDLMTKQNQMLYLEIHGIKDGQKVFNCGTRYDWYLIEKTNQYKNTIIIDEDGKHNEINLSELFWLPNSNIIEINKILAKNDEERCHIIQSMSAYEPRKKWMSSKETPEFKYPCVHSTPKAGVRYMYSKVNDRGHFSISKVIFGDSGIYNTIIDMEGKYGMTQHSMAIRVDNLEEAINVDKAIKSDKFNKIIQSCLYSTYAIDWNIFKGFKKDFWKELI
jgi:hypothetical protein